MTSPLRHAQKSLQMATVMVLMLASTARACALLHGEHREIIDAREIVNSEANIAHCLRSSLAKGNVGLARSIVELYDSQYEAVLAEVVEEEMMRLKQLQAELVQSESTYEPVAKWGQNSTHLFLSLKLSHRWDSPPCLNTKHQNTLSSPALLNYTNVCLVSNSKITFSFLLHFYDAVAPHPITVSRDGVGVYSAIIEKAEARVWPFLGKDEKSYPIWAEISERHNSVHKEYQALLDGLIRMKRSKPVITEEEKRSPGRETDSQQRVIESNEAANSEGTQDAQGQTAVEAVAAATLSTTEL